MIEDSINLFLLTTTCTIVGTLIGIFMRFWKKHIKLPIIWIVDDSLEDQALIVRNLEGRRYKIRCFSSPRGLAIEMALTKPDAVIADYKLQGYTIDGDKVVSFCKRHQIPVTIVTGYDGEIKNIDPTMIIKKTSPHFYKELNTWLHSVVH